MLLNKVGFFKELSYGEVDGLSLKELINKDDDREKESILNYLKSGAELIVSPGVVEDAFKPGKVIGTGPTILTDGVWVLPSDLIYYYEEYNVALPVDFLDNMKRNSWTVPDISEEELENYSLNV